MFKTVEKRCKIVSKLITHISRLDEEQLTSMYLTYKIKWRPPKQKHRYPHTAHYCIYCILRCCAHNWPVCNEENLINCK